MGSQSVMQFLRVDNLKRAGWKKCIQCSAAAFLSAKRVVGGRGNLVYRTGHALLRLQKSFVLAWVDLQKLYLYTTWVRGVVQHHNEEVGTPSQQLPWDSLDLMKALSILGLSRWSDRSDLKKSEIQSVISQSLQVIPSWKQTWKIIFLYNFWWNVLKMTQTVSVWPWGFAHVWLWP